FGNGKHASFLFSFEWAVKTNCENSWSFLIVDKLVDIVENRADFTQCIKKRRSALLSSKRRRILTVF
ncbi:MAG: hypothetical protein ACI4LH_06235, partial [Candidatus Heritagella sp.]